MHGGTPSTLHQKFPEKRSPELDRSQERLRSDRCSLVGAPIRVHGRRFRPQPSKPTLQHQCIGPVGDSLSTRIEAAEVQLPAAQFGSLPVIHRTRVPSPPILKTAPPLTSTGAAPRPRTNWTPRGASAPLETR